MSGAPFTMSNSPEKKVLLPFEDAVTLPVGSRVMFVYSDRADICSRLSPVASSSGSEPDHGQTFAASLPFPFSQPVVSDDGQKQQDVSKSVSRHMDLPAISITGMLQQIASTSSPASDGVPTVWLSVDTPLSSPSHALALALGLVELLRKFKAQSLHVLTAAQYKATKDKVHVLDLNTTTSDNALDSSLPRLDCPMLVQDVFVNSIVEMVRLYHIPSRFLIWPTASGDAHDSFQQAASSLSDQIQSLYAFKVAVHSNDTASRHYKDVQDADSLSRGKFESMYV
ncbi:hypothetical protein BASA61_007438 [Batrachochytrium salamandrivorans]|nr:hypothetical protein BASA61_007438 [Batrachochytrium salamandrivorans]KAH9252879.1 hypothetical protein BASA81_009182 [Batrachochytrium salamandrivorans]